MMKVPVINKSNNKLPEYAHEGDAGIDVRADFSRISEENPIKIIGEGEFIKAGILADSALLRIDPGSRVIIPTGIFTAIPKGYEVQLRPRSGLAIKQGLTLINAVGTLDAGYRNEWGVPLINLGHTAAWIEDGTRICQAVLNKVEQIEWEETDSLEESERGLGGFGSSGTK